MVSAKNWLSPSVPPPVTAIVGDRGDGLHWRQNARNWGVDLTLPPPFDERISPEGAAFHLAVGLFVAEEATLGQAAQIAGLSQADFLRELGRRRIPIHYGAEELQADLREIENLVRR